MDIDVYRGMITLNIVRFGLMATDGIEALGMFDGER